MKLEKLGVYRCENLQHVAVEKIEGGRALGSSPSHGPMSWDVENGQLIKPAKTGWDLEEWVGRIPDPDVEPAPKPTSSIHRLVDLVTDHPHARVSDRSGCHGITLEARSRVVVCLTWDPENPDAVHVNGHSVKSLWLLRACRERRVALLGVEDRIGEIVDEFTFEGGLTPGNSADAPMA